MAYASDLFEKVEYLRSKAAISYEEALSLLERYDDDMTRILIELERSGRLRPEPGDVPPEEYEDFHRRSGRKHHRHAAGFLTTLFKRRLEISRNGKSLVNLPIFCYLALLFAPHIIFPLIVVLFLTGCRVRHWKEPGIVREEDVARAVNKTAENIRVTVDSFSKGFHAERPKHDDDPDEGGEITIE